MVRMRAHQSRSAGPPVDRSGLDSRPAAAHVRMNLSQVTHACSMLALSCRQSAQHLYITTAQAKCYATILSMHTARMPAHALYHDVQWSE
eukprot:1474838-Alexandrium_andersonii.AAC.1